MIENEDSVVTSLNELRKLKHERITRQSQSRSYATSAGRAVALAEDPAQDQMTPPPVQAIPPVAQQPAAQPFGNAYAQPSPAPFAPMHFDTSPMPAPTIVKTKTSFTAAFGVAVVLIGAAGAGYVKLQGETQAKLLAKDAAIQQAEEARNRAAETAAKADVQSKTSLRQCEDKLKATMAAATPAAPAPAAVAAVAPIIEKPEKPAKIVHSRRAAKAARHVAAAPAPAAKAAKTSSVDVPTIAKKKKLDNDPLAGLGKL